MKITKSLRALVAILALMLTASCTTEPQTSIYYAVEFEQFDNWQGTDFVDATIDNYRKALQIAQRLEWGAAETTYTGESGKVNITLNTMLESDGESEYIVYIDGQKIGEVTNPRTFGTETKDYTISPNLLTEKRIKIKKGATIRVEFSSATNGLVPEGDLTATSRGRWSSVVIGQ